MSKIELHHGDCLEVMPTLDCKVDLVLADPPYGTTSCRWDTVIAFDDLWRNIWRLTKDEKIPCVLFGSEPFSTSLRNSQKENYKYDWIWDKVRPTGQLLAKIRPMKVHENILVFCRGKERYFRQMEDKPESWVRVNAVKNKENQKEKISQEHVGGVANKYADDYDPTKTNPKSILRFNNRPNSHTKNLHPTQKPVALLEYLIKTYTNEGDTVLDFCMGSGSTGVAALNLNRNFIGIEKDEEYFNIAKERIESAKTIFHGVASESASSSEAPIAQ